jgi:hypothetical protein
MNTSRSSWTPLHVLGISSDLFPRYTDSFYNHTEVGVDKVLENGTFKGMNLTYLTTKNVVSAARNHFGCDQIIVCGTIWHKSLTSRLAL